MATGVADFKIRNTALAIVSEGLVCQTNLKNLGRLRKALNRCLIVRDVAKAYIFTLG